MKKHHRVTRKERSIEHTLNAKKIQGARVISKRGVVIGKVSEIRINPSRKSIEGILISRGIFSKPIYVGASYIENVSEDGILIGIFPSVLLKGRKVMTSQGEIIGRVKKVLRKEHSNEIKEFVVRPLIGRAKNVSINQVKLLGETIILNSSYRAAKKNFWKKN